MAGWSAPIHSSGLLHADGLLCFRHAVHEHSRGRAARNEFLALAAVPDRVHDWNGLGALVDRVSRRPAARILTPMNAEIQTVIALLIVAAVAALLARSYFKKRKSPGCGAGCCPPDHFKKTLKSVD